MKKYVIATAVAAAAFAPQAFAQAKNFEGFSLAAGLNSVSTKMDWSGGATGSLSGSGTNVGLQAQYAMALGSSFVLGFGVSTTVGEVPVGTPTGGTEVKAKDLTAVYIAPGFAVSNDVQIYGKIASVNGTVVNATTSDSASGIGYGVGTQILGGKNIYYQIEYLSNKYDDKTNTGGTTTKTSTDIFSFSVGYKF